MSLQPGIYRQIYDFHSLIYILERVNRKKGVRPLLKRDLSVEKINKMLADREKYYSCADLVIDTSGKDLNHIVNEIIEVLKERMY
ncbi:MAG TPA: shikimate kinase [Syntrophomonadaceae bacterium]|nr:shikimate kinase [Syntrophomonadaceae bacterium]